MRESSMDISGRWIIQNIQGPVDKHHEPIKRDRSTRVRGAMFIVFMGIVGRWAMGRWQMGKRSMVRRSIDMARTVARIKWTLIERRLI